ncbi:MAG: zinc-ribbon domain-containing protein [Promethearchaeota archaeon]|nr:MAG: zinc-ribbon domain-containing protein [Candidatus Lokiarchaeota archaeon]
MSTSRQSKYCWGCGKPLKDSQKFCTYCGKPVKINKDAVPSTTNTQLSGLDPSIRTASFTPSQTSQSPYGQQNDEDLSTKYMKIAGVPQNSIRDPRSQELRSQEFSPSAIPSRSSPESDRYLRDKVDNIEHLLFDVDIKKKFEVLEYKLNALNIENKILDLNNKIDTMAERSQPLDPQVMAKLETLVTQKDIQGIHDRIDNLDMTTLTTLDSRLAQIEQKISQPREDSEQVVNLAKNTVSRLNSMVEKFDTNNLENRTRLKRLDEKMGQFDNRVERFTANLDLLVPSLVKLTEKINQLQDKVTILTNKTQKMETKPKSLDLPPFPHKQPLTLDDETVTSLPTPSTSADSQDKEEDTKSSSKIKITKKKETSD